MKSNSYNHLGCHLRQFLRFIPLSLATIILLLLTSCSNVPEGSTVGQAGLIIQHGDGEIDKLCIRFQGEEITGEKLLSLSELPHNIDMANPLGAIICSIDGEGCSFPEVKCFCQCDGPGSCSYWAYFIRGPEGDWLYAPLGARGRTVHDGDLDAWVWITGESKDETPSSLSLPDLTFTDICSE